MNWEPTAPFSPAHLREVLSYDRRTGLFRWRIKLVNGAHRRPVGRVKADGYARIKYQGVDMLAHRVAWVLVNGVWPMHMVDHENGFRADNRWKNLRDGSRGVNQRNQPLRMPAHQYLGVRQTKSGRWQARFGGRHLGTFNNAEAARDAHTLAKETL